MVVQRLRETLDAWDELDSDSQEHLRALLNVVGAPALGKPDESATDREHADFLLSLAEKSLPVLESWTSERLRQGEWETAIADLRGEIDRTEDSLRDLSEGPLLPATLDLALLMLRDPQLRARAPRPPALALDTTVSKRRGCRILF